MISLFPVVDGEATQIIGVGVSVPISSNGTLSMVEWLTFGSHASHFFLHSTQLDPISRFFDSRSIFSLVVHEASPPTYALVQESIKES